LRKNDLTTRAFSLVEVVLAIGIIAFAVIAILAIVPTALGTSHSAQDQTRAPQIAQSILSSFVAQAQTQFTTVAVPISSPSPAPALDLSSSNLPVTAPSPAAFLYADNNGTVSASPSGAVYSVIIGTNNAPSGFDANSANLVTVRIVTPPLPSPGATPTNNNAVRDYMRVISKY
jgi:Tfp pilus assembly protein PilV